MAVYPFYVESNAYGRKSPIAGGCKNKDGEQTTTIYTIYQRERGNIIPAFKVVQTSSVNPETGKRILMYSVYNRDGEVVARKETVY